MTDPLSETAIAAFLAELTVLSNRHGIEIVGCGCCGSPYLLPIAQPQRYVLLERAYPEAPYTIEMQTQG